MVEKLLAHATTLSEALRLPLPHLPKPESAKDQAASIGIADHSTAAGKDSASQESGMWEDEESRLFYESVVDLQVYVPAMFLNITTTKKPTGVDSSGDGDACDGTSQVRQAGNSWIFILSNSYFCLFEMNTQHSQLSFFKMGPLQIPKKRLQNYLLLKTLNLNPKWKNSLLKWNKTLLNRFQQHPRSSKT